jgi:hypothetical protein
MKHIYAQSTLRLVAAMLITVAVIGLSTFATHAPTQNQSSLTLKSIRTDRSTTFYADRSTNGGAWFVDLVYADAHTNGGAWFVDLVLPTGDSNAATENLKSVAATL